MNLRLLQLGDSALPIGGYSQLLDTLWMGRVE